MKRPDAFFLLHPSDEQIAALIDGGLGPIERDVVEVHLVNCDDCRTTAGGVILTRLEMEAKNEWGV